jgi:hypothetical protein
MKNTQIIDYRFVSPELEAIVCQTNPILHNRESLKSDELLDAVTKLTAGLETVKTFEGSPEYSFKYFKYYQIMINYRKLILQELDARLA